VVQLEASESATQPMMGMGGMSPIMLKELARVVGPTLWTMGVVVKLREEAGH
jgi:hypothetical protein